MLPNFVKLKAKDDVGKDLDVWVNFSLVEYIVETDDGTVVSCSSSEFLVPNQAAADLVGNVQVH